MSIENERLLSLIEFAQHSARLKLSSVLDATKHGIFYRFEHELTALPGVHFNHGDDQEEIWLRVERLLETTPPKTKIELLTPWLELSNNFNVAPILKEAAQLDDPFQDPKTLTLLSEYAQQEEVRQAFKSYLDYQWQPWALEEKKRRITIKLYSELFTIKQQLDGSASDAPLELAWGIGVGLWKTDKFSIKYPTLTQLVELSFNEIEMTLEIRPRQTDTRLESDLYMSIDNQGIADLEKAYKDLAAKQTQAFSPFDRCSYESQLQIAVAYLDSKGIYWPSKTTAEDRSLPDAGEELKITDTWMLFVRPRSKSIFIQDLENFKSNFDEKSDLLIGSVAHDLVKNPLSEHEEIRLTNFRGLSSLGGYQGDRPDVADLFFPLPFNEEQVSIVQRLECSNGVVVQGPPGTGKTHSIANIISHYMANGKRVLVTSMKEPALAVLKEKLPEAIRPLAISILTNEHEGMKQFEFAVSKIAQELQTINRRTLELEIIQEERYIDLLHAELSKIDLFTTEWANKNIQPFMLDGNNIFPEQAAKEVRDAMGQYEWLDDNILITSGYALKIDNTDVMRLREARRLLAIDLHYLNAKLPEIDIFPGISELLQLHRNLIEYNSINDILRTNEFQISTTNNEIFNQIEILINFCSVFGKNKEIIQASKKEWVCLVKQLLEKTNSDPFIKILDALTDEIENSVSEKQYFLEKPISLPEELKLNDEVLNAIYNKSQGKLAFGISGLIAKGNIKKLFDEIYIIGNKPNTTEDWSYIHQYIIFQRKLKELIIRWNSIASELTLPIFDINNIDSSIKKINEELEIYKTIKASHSLRNDIFDYAKIVFINCPYIEDISENDAFFKKFYDSLNYHAQSFKLSNAQEKIKNLREMMKVYSGEICESIKLFFIDIIGNINHGDTEIKNEWSKLISELSRILSFRGYFCDIKEISNRIKESGGSKWAEKLSNEPLLTTVDKLLPDNWLYAWRCRRLENYLISSGCFSEFKKLTLQRIEKEKHLSRTYQKVIEKRTWLKLSTNATPDIKAALQAFQAAVAKIGKGTGKRAIRYRRDARNAAALTSKAIPCWIMSHYRVLESLPSEFGYFDLVIIDEASQSDLNALPAILRAKKLLVVGDDRQISPDGAGIEEEKIISLMDRFLSNQVEIYRQAMSPDRSIYDLCKIVFANSQIMLREHFRCVSPIIEYSKREFYKHELRPLRLPVKSERLDPPLIDVFLEGGYRKSKYNECEARFIVDEIKRICNDPEMKERTIGVVSLLGNEQSRKIWEMIQSEINIEIQTKHKIKCGDALTFQGEERSIMFLSMVATRDDVQANSGKTFEQRFNVAASRARDRMYLVRSVDSADLSAADQLRRKLIEHFASPFSQDKSKVKNLRELCESGFECEVYDLLTERGYRVVPQVEVGSFRIDMVVEGHNDTRLAIECDGDRYHDASRWESDMNRQRILERAGWSFWRCFASTFVLNKESVIADLVSTLTEKGIEPIGSDGVFNNIHTEHRRITLTDVLTACDDSDQ